MVCDSCGHEFSGFGWLCGDCLTQLELRDIERRAEEFWHRHSDITWADCGFNDMIAFAAEFARAEIIKRHQPK